MSDQEKANRETPAPVPAASHPGGAVNPHADQLHGRLAEEFKRSLATEAAGVFARWGYAWLHSMSDEEVMAQREALGIEPIDALDFYNLGCLRAQREDYAGAAKAFVKAAHLDPKLQEAAFNLALALELDGKKTEARDAWNACLERLGDADEDADEAKQVKDHLAALAEA
jgi:tetratricopeptide (TPR) repeat protein